MAGFCTKCGTPLPESGICSCTVQQPQQQAYAPQPQQPYTAPQQAYVPQQPQQSYAPQQPYTPRPQQPYVAPQYSSQPSYVGKALSGSLKNLPNLWVGYFRDPVGTTRLASEKRDHVSGLLMLGVEVLLALLGTLLFVLVQLTAGKYSLYDFGDLALPWVGISILGPCAAFGLNIGLTYALAALSKVRVDFRSVVAVSGVSGVLPSLLLVLSLFLGMIGPFFFYLFAVLMCGAWVITFFTNAFHVFKVKMSIVSMLVLLVGLAVSFYIIQLLLGWFLYDGEYLTFTSLLSQILDRFS